jgi:hypothetical protein
VREVVAVGDSTESSDDAMRFKGSMKGEAVGRSGRRGRSAGRGLLIWASLSYMPVHVAVVEYSSITHPVVVAILAAVAVVVVVAEKEDKTALLSESIASCVSSLVCFSISISISERISVSVACSVPPSLFQVFRIRMGISSTVWKYWGGFEWVSITRIENDV